MNLSKVAVGLILVSFGTSIPEFAVAIFAGLGGAELITVGTLIGSNVTNLTLVLGIAGLFGVISFTHRDIRVTLSLVLTSVIGFIALLSGNIGPAFGLFALVLYAFFIFVVLQERYAPGHIPRAHKRMEVANALVILFAAIGLVLMSARFLTEFSVSIATELGLQLSIVGMIIAFGTSLPEVSVAVTAIRAKRSSLALGTLVGSSLSNIGLILGLAVFISPIEINNIERIMISGMLVVNALYLVLSSRRKIGKIEAGFLIAVYASFVVLLSSIA